MKFSQYVICSHSNFSFRGQNILLSILVPGVLKAYFSLTVEYQLSHPYQVTCKITAFTYLSI
jgi:hypothetical protein